MGRKSKQPGGHQPLTHYERTQKFASSEYGTVRKRLAGHSQYQLGDCALTVAPLDSSTTALCSPSGYLYQESAILEYLLQKTQELKQQQTAYDKQQAAANDEADESSKKRAVAEFEESQRVVKKSKTGAVTDPKAAAVANLKRVSYWLADSQPDAVTEAVIQPPASRPPSPVTGAPLRRKDLWPVTLQRTDDGNKLQCAVSGKTIQTQAAMAYWTDKKQPGSIVLQTVYDDLIADTKRCPTTNKKIKYTRTLQKSGSSFASSGQTVQVQKYRPTIT